MSALDSVLAKPVFKNAPRVNRSLTANAEKRVLVWMAERTPRALHSDHLTAFGFISQLLAGAAYALASVNKYALLLASALIVLNWLGDSLDGTLARVRDCQRPRYGFYVDHVIDSFGAVALMAGLGVSGYIDFRIALGMLAGFLLLSAESYLATYTLGRFHMSHGLFGPTEIRLLMILGNAVLLLRPQVHILGEQYWLLDVGGLVAIACMILMAVVAGIRHTRELYLQETIR
ncbi:MAG: CDP-alcohol phosphatidyltransferase family protein [Candidatus Korobacteraceae bacterium]